MKILVLRFSSIGDIVLTTPVIRALKSQVENAEIHYFTKKNYKVVIDGLNYIDKIYTFEKSTKECLSVLKAEKYDVIIDLHKNIRTKKLISKLAIKHHTFPKLNIRKWLLTRFKINIMPKKHIVDRYFEAVKALGVTQDSKPCDYKISDSEIFDLKSYNLEKKQYVAVAIGAQFNTKKFPVSKQIETWNKIDQKVVLLGGKEDYLEGEEILAKTTNKSIINLCGKLSLDQSAAVARDAGVVVSNDTGMMHIASCFDVPIISIWGNTVPDFGMYPYHPEKKNFTMHEVENLKCRPCSKIGYQKCPQGHFKCMLDQDSERIAKEVIKAMG